MNCEEKLVLHGDDLIPIYKEQKWVALIEKENVQNPEYDKYPKSLIIDSSVKVPKKNHLESHLL